MSVTASVGLSGTVDGVPLSASASAAFTTGNRVVHRSQDVGVIETQLEVPAEMTDGLGLVLLRNTSIASDVLWGQVTGNLKGKLAAAPDASGNGGVALFCANGNPVYLQAVTESVKLEVAFTERYVTTTTTTGG